MKKPTAMQANLPPAEKKVLAKVLSEAGYSTRTIEDWLGVDNVSVFRYAKQETPEDLKRFETEAKDLIEQGKKKGIVLTVKRMLEIIPRYDRLDHLVKAAEYFEGKRDVGVAIQVNLGDSLSQARQERGLE